jgi:hypothetical protein
MAVPRTRFEGKEEEEGKRKGKRKEKNEKERNGKIGALSVLMFFLSHLFSNRNNGVKP